MIKLKNLLSESAVDLKGKTIDDLIELGIFFRSKQEFTQQFGIDGLHEYDELIPQTDAYKKLKNSMTDKPLVGSEKQVKWAEKIREKVASKVARKLVKAIHMTKIGFGDVDYNELGRIEMGKFNNNSAAYYIDNRFSF